jgi:hypothetical protein
MTDIDINTKKHISIKENPEYHFKRGNINQQIIGQLITGNI